MAKDPFDKTNRPTVLQKIAETKNADKPQANDQHKPKPPQLAPGQSSQPRGHVGASQTQIDDAKRRATEIKEGLAEKAKQRAPQALKERALTREFNRARKL